jgi:hypothetical protein
MRTIDSFIYMNNLNLSEEKSSQIAQNSQTIRTRDHLNVWQRYLKREKKKEKKMMMKSEKNRLKFVQKFCDQRELLQQIVLHQLFDDRFEFFARVRHDMIIVDVDVFKQLISITH